MLVLLKFHLFISTLLEFLFCVLSSSHSNSESHFYNFLKFHEYMTNMMRICLLQHHQCCQHLTIHPSDILVMKHFSYTKEIMIQFLKKVPLLGAYAKFRCSLSQSYASVYFMICSKGVFLKHFSMKVHNRQTKIA